MAGSGDAQRCNGYSHQVLVSILIDLDNPRADLVTNAWLAISGFTTTVAGGLTWSCTCPQLSMQ